MSIVLLKMSCTPKALRICCYPRPSYYSSSSALLLSRVVTHNQREKILPQISNFTKRCASNTSSKPKNDKSSINPSVHSFKQNENPWWNSTTRNTLFAVGSIAAAFTLYQFSDRITPSQADESDKKDDVKDSAKLVKDPSTSNQIPSEVPYLLIGGGTASFAAFRAIKSFDPSAKVLLISEEEFKPYMRPPLNKQMFYPENEELIQELKFYQWNGVKRSIYYEPEEFYTPCEELMDSSFGGVSVAQGWKVVSLDLEKREAELDDGKKIKFEKCLLATGASPKSLEMFKDSSIEVKNRITAFRNLKDFQLLDSKLKQGAKSIVILGNGILASEMACALARRDNIKVFQVFSENGVLQDILPQYLSKWTTEQIEKQGVTLFPSSNLKEAKMRPNGKDLVLSLDDSIIVADHVVVAVGDEPNTDLAKKSGLEVDSSLGGFLVNAEMQARENIFAAGDCASFYDPKLGRRRLTRHDHAVITGRLAGENMAVTKGFSFYKNQSMFWSDLGPSIGFEAIGIIDSSLPTVGVFPKVKQKQENLLEQEPLIGKSQETNTKNSQSENDLSRGVVFYLKDDVIVGIVLWNLFNKMKIAKQIIESNRNFEDLNELAKHFGIHQNEQIANNN